MADLTPKERLQPALLDRLSDDAPERRTESREDRVISLRRLRELVIRDLEWLFNTGALYSPDDDVDPDRIVATSVLNYGIPNFAGVQASSLSLPRLERLIRDTIWNFEPRLLRESVRVKAVDGKEMNHHALVFEIEARLWAVPMPIELFLRTELDLETGDVTVREPGRDA